MNRLQLGRNISRRKLSSHLWRKGNSRLFQHLRLVNVSFIFVGEKYKRSAAKYLRLCGVIMIYSWTLSVSVRWFRPYMLSTPFRLQRPLVIVQREIWFIKPVGGSRSLSPPSLFYFFGSGCQNSSSSKLSAVVLDLRFSPAPTTKHCKNPLPISEIVYNVLHASRCVTIIVDFVIILIWSQHSILLHLLGRHRGLVSSVD